MPLTLVPWHQDAFAHLQTLVEREQLGHAWLFSGLQGIGKADLARYIAASLLCRYAQAGHPCGQCQDCHLIQAGNHPDWRLLQPEKRQIVVDQIRDSIAYAANKSHRGGYKVLCIDPAESMNINAANALLKLLEEPPAATLLILVSHQPGLLLPTLRSRCQQLKVRPPETGQAVAWLQDQGFSGDAALMLARAGGAPLRALDLTDSGVIAEHETILGCVRDILDGNMSPVRAAGACEKISTTTTIEYLMQCTATLLRHLQTGQSVRDPELKALQESLDAAMATIGNTRLRHMTLHRLLQALETCRRTAQSANNPNPRLLLEQVFGFWAALRQMKQAAG